MRSEVADATGIVKYTHKRVFRHQPPKTFWGGGGGYGPPASLLLRRLCEKDWVIPW